MEGENIRTLSQIGNGKFAVANKCGDMWVYDSCLQTVLLHESSEHNVYCVAEIGNGHLWKGTKGGGLYIDLKSATYRVSWDFACETTKNHFFVHNPCTTETSQTQNPLTP